MGEDAAKTPPAAAMTSGSRLQEAVVSLTRQLTDAGAATVGEVSVPPDEHEAVSELLVAIDRLVNSAEERAAAAEARAERLAQQVSDLEQFAYVASHDLQEPLRLVSSFLTLLERRCADELSEEARDYINHATEGAKWMQRLIRDLLAFSRVRAADLDSGPANLKHALNGALLDLRDDILATNATVDHGALPLVRGDQAQIKQLFMCVLSNALKFRRAVPPRIAVGAVREDDMWRVTVGDNGIGIPAEQTERVFEIFKRLHPRSEYPGTGIGLPIARRIVEGHGGSIWAEPGHDGGTTVSFTLPAAD